MKDEVRISYTLRRRQKVDKPSSMPWPRIGDMLEVDGKLSVCTAIYKGNCDFIDEDNVTGTFVLDEARHGPCKVKWKVRYDL